MNVFPNIVTPNLSSTYTKNGPVFEFCLDQIWSALDEEDYLTATQHFLLSRHIHTSLQLESQQSGNLLSMFPVLTRQWAAISHFRTTILQVCHNGLIYRLQFFFLMREKNWLHYCRSFILSEFCILRLNRFISNCKNICNVANAKFLS